MLEITRKLALIRWHLDQRKATYGRRHRNKDWENLLSQFLVTEIHAGNPSMQLGEEEQLNKASLIEKQLIIKNSSDAKTQSGSELQLTEDDYERKISSLQVQLENYEKASPFTIQQKLQQLHVQCENQLLVSKREMDAVWNKYENKIDILYLQLTSMEEEKKKYQLGVNEIETEKVRDLQNEIWLLKARCAEQNNKQLRTA